MRKLIKTSSLILGSVLVILIIGLLSTYLWLSTEWKDHYSEKEMKEIANEITNSKTLPNNFYVAYERVYLKQRDRTLLKMSGDLSLSIFGFNSKLLESYRQCNSLLISGYFENKIPIKYKSWSAVIFAFGVEKYTSESKCLDYRYEVLELEGCSYKYFKKDLNELLDIEYIELIYRIEKPTLYEKRPELLDKIIRKYK